MNDNNIWHWIWFMVVSFGWVFVVIGAMVAAEVVRELYLYYFKGDHNTPVGRLIDWSKEKRNNRE